MVLKLVYYRWNIFEDEVVVFKRSFSNLIVMSKDNDPSLMEAAFQNSAKEL